MPDRDAAMTIPEPLQRLVRQHIPSLHQLEILLCVYSQPLRPWRAEAVALQLYLPLDLVDERLVDLTRRGLITADDAVSPAAYAAAPEQQALIAQLAAYYQQHRIKLTTFIFSQPSEVVQSFAAAFKFRKES